MNSVLEQMLSKYDIKNSDDKINAIKGIVQEIVLCGLSRGNFFDEAAFYGGTALRIFYSLDRFSEDLDFSLLKPNKDFDFSKYFSYIEKEVNSYGLNLSISEKVKTKDSNIKSAFLKGDTKEHILIFFPNQELESSGLFKDIKIKFEIDVNPPSGANYDFKYKLLPAPHVVRLYDESSLFAGKIHAVLCRGWGNRIKGRDLYDYVFYLSKDINVNLELVRNKLIESGVISSRDEFSIVTLKDMLYKRFKEINYEDAKKDVIPFISNIDAINLWCEDFFVSITNDKLN